MSGVLSPERIETLNAWGPYHHAVWEGNGMTVTQEGALTGRARFLARKIRASILRRYRRQDLPSLSVLDVGCYDGWILHSLSDLPFRRLVGIEPREKNIRKGEVVREALGIESRVEFRQGELVSLGEEQFDIVLCLGVLHHLESPGEALRRLHAACRGMLFLETICLSSRHLTDAVARELEMKDVVYFGARKRFGLSGQKLESAHYDGSATRLSVVNIPSVESLLLYLEVAGFTDPVLAAAPDAYRAAVWEKRRACQAVCVDVRAGDTAQPVTDEHDHGRRYERQLARIHLPPRFLEPLYRRFCLVEPMPRSAWWCRLAAMALSDSGWRGGCAARIALGFLSTEAEREIFRTLRFSPADKLRVEYGKWLCREGRWREAVDVFRQVTEEWNADWRSVYRGFAWLARCWDRLGDAARADRYRDLCLTANPGFPADLLPLPRPKEPLQGLSPPGGGVAPHNAESKRSKPFTQETPEHV